MNNKMAMNSYVSKINLRNRKQEEERQNHGYQECSDGFQMGGVYGGIGEEVRGLRSTNR